MAIATERLEFQVRGEHGRQEGAALGSSVSRAYLGVATFQDGQWASLCRELDIASFGASAEEALMRLDEMVRDLLAYSREEGRPLGPGAPEDEVRDFILAHEGPGPIVARTIWA